MVNGNFGHPKVIWVCGNGVNAARRVLGLNRVLYSRYFSHVGMFNGVRVNFRGKR